jgi:hypothetical protein
MGRVIDFPVIDRYASQMENKAINNDTRIYQDKLVEDMLDSFARDYEFEFENIKEVYDSLFRAYMEHHEWEANLLDTRCICLDATLLVLEERKDEIEN